MKPILPLSNMMLTLSSVALPFPPTGDDLEALQIHLCSCRFNLHPQKTARSRSTLVSSAGNIYLSQQTGNKPARSSETSDRQTEPTAGRALTACSSPVLWRGFKTDWICLPFCSHLKTNGQILLLQNLFDFFFKKKWFLLFFPFLLLTSVSFSMDAFFAFGF